ncbi:GntR family transcriptional regulator [Catenovulum agarivorans]|nr:GntR family transcriptional regulator [Catenovulum agarivorans]
MSPLINDDNSIYSRILNDIANSIFISGDRLVTTALAKKYNTSITPVREALKQLQGEGFVTVAPNSGARVAKFEYTTMRDVLEILQLLEPYLMEWFVNEHTAEDYQQLTELVEQMETADDLTFRQLDTLFHWNMYKVHYNQNAVNLWRKNRLTLMAIHSNVSLNSSRIEQSIQEHKEIMQALKERSMKKTLVAMNKHLGSSAQYWSRYIGKVIS